MVWVGRDLKDHLIPPPHIHIPHVPPGQAAPSPTQPGLGHCQGWGTPSSSGQPGPGPQHPQMEEFLPNASPKPPPCQAPAGAPRPVPPALTKSPSPAFLPPLQALAGRWQLSPGPSLPQAHHPQLSQPGPTAESSFSPTTTPRSLSSGLLSNHALPSLELGLGLRRPCCRTLHLHHLKQMEIF